MLEIIDQGTTDVVRGRWRQAGGLSAHTSTITVEEADLVAMRTAVAIGSVAAVMPQRLTTIQRSAPPRAVMLHPREL